MDSKNKGEEKRIFERVEVPTVKVSYKHLDPRAWSTFQEKAFIPAKNISLGGIAMPANQELHLTAPVGVDIKLDTEHEPIRVFGRVVWIKRDEENAPGYSMGIRFCWWEDDKDRKSIKELIEKNKA